MTRITSHEISQHSYFQKVTQLETENSGFESYPLPSLHHLLMGESTAASLEHVAGLQND